MIRLGSLVLFFFLPLAFPAHAVEYRLQTAHLHEKSFSHFFDGRIGKGQGELTMERLERSLDSGTMARGALLYDRASPGAVASVAQAFRAARASGRLTDAASGEGQGLWEETVWDGRAGERSVWLIAPLTTREQEVIHVALKGSGPLRYHVPYGVAIWSRPAEAVSFPLDFLRLYEGRAALWDRYLVRSLRFQERIGAVVGVNANPSFADWVYIVVEHPIEPTTFKVVVGWDRRRSADASNLEGFGQRE